MSDLSHGKITLDATVEEIVKALEQMRTEYSCVSGMAWHPVGFPRYKITIELDYDEEDEEDDW